MLTLILPYYRQPEMLAEQLRHVAEYPAGIHTVIVDDGSPEPARFDPLPNVSLYRIIPDIPWNRGQARNLGAWVATTDWILQTDIDHVLMRRQAEQLVGMLDGMRSGWYRFPRTRWGRADETRRKDNIGPDQESGPIHPHIDSYLITREQFLASPYDERYSGCLGGGSPFLDRMTKRLGQPPLLPMCLYVYTRDKVKDASISTLDRGREEYARRRALLKDSKPPRMLCHPWRKVQ